MDERSTPDAALTSSALDIGSENGGTGGARRNSASGGPNGDRESELGLYADQGALKNVDILWLDR
jgi:hypothetical protein